MFKISKGNDEILLFLGNIYKVSYFFKCFNRYLKMDNLRYSYVIVILLVMRIMYIF